MISSSCALTGEEFPYLLSSLQEETEVGSSFHGCLAALALAGATAGCSGSDAEGSPGAGDRGADAALAEPTCYLGLTVPGLSYSGLGCSGTDTQSSVTGISSSFDPVISVAVALDAPPAVGPLSVSTLTVDLPTDGTSHLWNAPSSCTLVATGKAVEEFFGWDYYRIDVSCPEAATPASGNAGEPLELGDFSIVTFFDPNG